MSWSLSYKNKPISSELYNKTPTYYYFLCKIDMKNIIYNPSSLLNLTITVTGSYMDLFLLSALYFAAFWCCARQWHFNKALVCACWILSKITVRTKWIEGRIFPDRGLPENIKSTIFYLHWWMVCKVLMITIFL